MIEVSYELTAPIYDIMCDIKDKNNINQTEKVMRNRINNTYFSVIGDLDGNSISDKEWFF